MQVARSGKTVLRAAVEGCWPRWETDNSEWRVVPRPGDRPQPEFGFRISTAFATSREL